MKKPALLILIAMSLIFLVTLLGQRRQGRQTHEAWSRIVLDARVSTAVIYDPYFFQKQMRAISNYLCQPDNHNNLARLSNVEEKDFYLSDVRPVRGTLLIQTRFTGFESNQVLCIASNASVMLVNFYSTNQPAWDVHFAEAYYSVPKTFWQRQLEDAKLKLYWAFHQ
jgi:hypothetical protein